MSRSDAVTRIAEQLIKEALWDGERATWLGDDRLSTGTTVYRAVGGDLYGGTAGIATFLARYATHSGDPEAARAARGALAHAISWANRTRPDGALMSGTAGIAVAALDAAKLLQDDHLATQAAHLTRTTLQRIPTAIDLICGRSGTLLALLHLARGLPTAEMPLTAHALHPPNTHAPAPHEQPHPTPAPRHNPTTATAAHNPGRWPSPNPVTAAVDAIGRGLVEQAQPGPVTGRCWPSDISDDGPPLCGLAHGASGVALALLEWGATDAAADAAAYERSWYSPDHNNWPDLREGVAWPAFWCHGALGIGVARLRQYDLTGNQVYAAEAGAAIDTVVRSLGSMAVQDLSICHGLSGAVDFLLDAAQVFAQPVLRTAAIEAMEAAIERVGDSDWPCGVPEGGENPSLFLGLAGIGTTLLRTLDARTPSTVLAYAGGTMAARVIVQLGSVPENLRDQAESISRLVPGARVERISPRGRVLLRLPAEADITAALASLNAMDNVEYAELDVTDTAQD
ncbi:lanthionine synthetase LanC family protein [Nonomuraea sp. NPDC050556]|uniref:lanthionine synthetase LanC family protein n=1 Tax=Nonomuraea sp. NPDC050556 TaxID=3364369 RepID=UPI0037A14761